MVHNNEAIAGYIHFQLFLILLQSIMLLMTVCDYFIKANTLSVLFQNPTQNCEMGKTLQLYMKKTGRGRGKESTQR